MKENYPNDMRIGGQKFEPQKYAVDVWIQGHVFHDDETKWKELGLDRMLEPERKALLIQFWEYFVKAATQVLLVRDLLKRAFRLKLVS